MGIKSNYNKRNIMKIKMTASILVLALSLGAAEIRVKPAVLWRCTRIAASVCLW